MKITKIAGGSNYISKNNNQTSFTSNNDKNTVKKIPLLENDKTKNIIYCSAASLIAVAGLFFMGRKGFLGTKIKTLLGGAGSNPPVPRNSSTPTAPTSPSTRFRCRRTSTIRTATSSAPRANPVSTVRRWRLKKCTVCRSRQTPEGPHKEEYHDLRRGG